MRFFRTVAEDISGALIVSATALAALKFGTLAALPEEPAFFPRTAMEFIVAGFPASSFGIVAALALLTALLSGRTTDFDGGSGRTAALFAFVFPAAALVGAVNSLRSWIVADYLHHFIAVGALVLAAEIWSRNRPERKNALFFAAAAGCIAVALAALDQYFFSLDATRALVREEMSRGVHYSEAMLAKLYDDRVFATMTSANILAGFLLLGAPVAVVAAYEAAKKFSPRAAFAAAAIAGTLMFAVFLLTKTRGAFLAAILTALFVCWTGQCAKKYKILAAVAAVAVIATGGYYIQTYGRGFSSAAERTGYVSTVAAVAAEHPVAGGGWGSFFIEHMKRKTSATDETPRDPHNVVLSFVAQCGIPAGLAVGVALGCVVLRLYRRRKNSPWNGAVFVGATGFLLHSMIEINHMAPGSFALLGILAVAAADNDADAKRRRGENFFRAAGMILAVAALLLSRGLMRRDLAFTRYVEAVESGDETAAHARLPGMLAAAPDAPFVREAAGDAAWSRGRFGEAESFWREAWKLAPDNPATCQRLALAARRRGDEKEAEQWEKKERELFPSRPIR
ncbi:MAG: O-antigen ligase family protein [Victivallaceae bacterium]|nr:O-antigen ligase family protein [Victivallaceae bacterium]